MITYILKWKQTIYSWLNGIYLIFTIDFTNKIIQDELTIYRQFLLLLPYISLDFLCVYIIILKLMHVSK